MSRMLFTIRGSDDRRRVSECTARVEIGTRVEFKQAKRSDEQNAKFWAMLSEVAEQCPWHGVTLTPDDWKFVFIDALKRELRVVPNIDGTGLVSLGRSSSDLTKSEMSDLIELIHAFGAEHGVKFQDSSQAAVPPIGAETDTPAAEASALVAGNHQEASLLSDDWKHVYLIAMERVNDRPHSVLSRHQEALQMIGGEPNNSEKEWMRAVYRLTERRLRCEISKDECDAAIQEVA